MNREPENLDYKLTAFALGELQGEEHKLMAETVARDPELAKEVEEIRRTASELERVFAEEEAPPLDEKLWEKVEAQIDRKTKPKSRKIWWLASGGVATALAASIAVIFTTARYEAQPASIEKAEIRKLSVTPRPKVMISDDAEEEREEIRVHLDGYLQPRSGGGTARGQVNELPRMEAVSVPSAEGKGFRVGSISGLKGSGMIPTGDLRGEGYTDSGENEFLSTSSEPLSTFSIDVDTASYSNLRRMLEAGQRPPKEAIRIEELINYFPYRLPPPSDGAPFALHVDVTDAPWKTDHLLARVALKGREVARAERPKANLVFLIDVSGSMETHNKLPLVKKSLALLLEELAPEDTVALVVYAGASGLVLPPTPAAQRGKIQHAIDRLGAGGSTDGGSGIQLAYEIARRNFKPGGTNRVILATDGDFNVGVVNRQDLEALIVEKAKSGVFLTVLGFGMGNYQDATLETLADKGNGNYAYIDRLAEAQKVLVEQIGGTLITIAKDVKIQVQLNPARISSYRLIGYENRRLAARDFDDDKKDAGEIGAGHAVTALYELVPASSTSGSGDLFTVRLRYKDPEGDSSKLIERSVHQSLGHYKDGSDDLRFAAAVAAFGMVLRNSPHRGDATLDKVQGWAGASLGPDNGGLRSELIKLIQKAKRLSQ